MRRLYVDMDGVLVDFDSGVARLDPWVRLAYVGHLDDAPGIFALMDPLPGALEAFAELAQLFDTYVLSTAPWRNPSAWSDKLLWVQRHLGEAGHKRLILCHHKDLLQGDFLVDDRRAHGADRFPGEHILFGAPAFPDWPAVLAYLRDRADDAAPGDARPSIGRDPTPGGEGPSIGRDPTPGGEGPSIGRDPTPGGEGPSIGRDRGTT